MQESSDVATEAELYAGLADVLPDMPGNQTVVPTQTNSAGRGFVEWVAITGAGRQPTRVNRLRPVAAFAQPVRARAA